ncbi:unnamed protein product [Orchesella dallaii]|uniref:BTB domain-containing protein n=1 Tax=Orchesella dallaii TaxID=48710 RepID=A0ABP1QA70_9HEXA
MSMSSRDSRDFPATPLASNGVEVLARNLCDTGFKYNWSIEDYLKGVDQEIDVDSSVFEINVNGLQTKWSLALRYWMDENGLRLTNPVVICLNLVSAVVTSPATSLVDYREQLQVRYQFGIWNPAVKQYEVCPVGIHTVEATSEPTKTLTSIGARDIIILDRHLSGKSIEIFCKIMLVREELEQHSLALDLWTKLRSGENCDITIHTADGSLVPAHRTILTCRSPVVGSLIDKEGHIKVDMSTPLLTSLLQYIYTDRVDPLDSPEKLLKFAVQLEMPGLKNICEKALIDSITPRNVAALLLIADTFGCDMLKKSALGFCEENSSQIVKTVAWKVMEEVNPKLFEEVCQTL